MSTFRKQAVTQNGAKLISIDPRRTEMVDFSTLWLRQQPGTDTALFNAMAHVVVKEELYNEGAIYSSMSGSGSVLFGIFNK